MIFNSFTYLFFLVAIVALYWRLGSTARLMLVFLSSLVFYGFWRIEFIPVMLVSVITDYWAALRMSAVSQKRSRKPFLVLSLAVNLSLLFYFKYLIFFAENALSLASFLGFELDEFGLKVILPLGISFYTFQTISYSVDVYRGHARAEKNFITFASYVTFFPQLVAGPILRVGEVIQQLKCRPPFVADFLWTGSRLILIGLFLKVCLADNIAPLVDTGFATDADELSAIDVWTMAFLFGFQIYFDFSAYSYIAAGSARLMGIKFPHNFNFPYIAVSPRDFWKRWHISLSSWIRDYLYLPLTGANVRGKSEGGLAREVSQSGDTNKALVATWAIMGLWHGANWTFVVWGLYHALCILVYRSINNLSVIQKGLGGGMLGILITLPIMMLGWIPFRAETLGAAGSMMMKVVNPLAYSSLNLTANTYIIAAVVCVFSVTLGLIKGKVDVSKHRAGTLFYVVDWFAIVIMFTATVIFLRPVVQFIYFQF